MTPAPPPTTYNAVATVCSRTAESPSSWSSKGGDNTVRCRSASNGPDPHVGHGAVLFENVVDRRTSHAVCFRKGWHIENPTCHYISAAIRPNVSSTLPVATMLRAGVVLILSASNIACEDPGRSSIDDPPNALPHLDTASLAADEASSGGNAVDGVEGESWQLSPRPLFAVPESTGQPELVLLAGAMVILPGYSVAVGNADEVLILDSTGYVVRRIGRKGSGPGEFLNISQLFHAGSDIGIFDSRQQRVTVVSMNGRVQTTTGLAETPAASVPGWISPAGFVVVPLKPPSVNRQYLVRSERTQQNTALPELKEPPSMTVRFVAADGRSRQANSMCRPRILDAVVGGRLYSADTGTASVIATALDGKRSLIYRLSNRVAISEQLHAHLRRAYAVNGVPSDSIDSVLGRFGRPGDPQPAWDDMFADPEGRLWLRAYSCLPMDRSLWTVIDTAGAMLATVSVPSVVALRAARGEVVAGMSYDSLEVPYVHLYRLMRAAPSPKR